MLRRWLDAMADSARWMDLSLAADWLFDFQVPKKRYRAIESTSNRARHSRCDVTSQMHAQPLAMHFATFGKVWKRPDGRAGVIGERRGRTCEGLSGGDSGGVREVQAGDQIPRCKD